MTNEMTRPQPESKIEEHTERLIHAFAVANAYPYVHGTVTTLLRSAHARVVSATANALSKIDKLQNMYAKDQQQQKLLRGGQSKKG